MNNRASWDEGTTKILLDLCIEQKNQLNWSDRCLTKLGWRNVYSSFRAQTGLQLGSKQLQNKLNNLRRQFLGWRALQNSSGLGHDTQTGGVSADATTPPASSARASARAMSKRPVREFSVDSPTKKRSDNLEQYIRELFESMAKRSLLRGPSTHDQTSRCIEILKEDGIEEGSELHNQAMFLCGQSAECRSTFMGLGTKEGRMSWMKFYWDMTHKK
uniref:Myb/SANT-like domain-containing protein n=1 Tax=Setaria italica TaxID=4555 RepID=K3YEE2_SETIT